MICVGRKKVAVVHSGWSATLQQRHRLTKGLDVWAPLHTAAKGTFQFDICGYQVNGTSDS